MDKKSKRRQLRQLRQLHTGPNFVNMITRRFVLACLILYCLFISTTFAAKPSLEVKVAKLNDASKKNGIVDLDSNLFDEFVAKPRNYSFVVLLTAMDSRLNCIPCREFDPEFRLVAKTWKQIGNPVDRVYFGLLDFINGKEIFNKLKQTSAPSLWYYAPTEGPFAKQVTEPDKYDFGRKGFGAEPFASFVSAHLGTPIPITRPPNYFLMAVYGLLFTGLLAFLKMVYPMIQKFIWNRNVWAALSLVIILMMTSGHMWNQIRTPPYVISQHGRVSYVASGFQSQFGLESQIVAVMYGVCALSTIALITSVPKLNDPIKQRFGIYVSILWTGILVAMFSLVFALFRVKQPGYPFRLFI
ncbi:7568_t:CDS:2 [Paraglomus occultum]|uniref:7568_t:CDS:1 n=1 Tax=Paraglomus occultum TaxID=144539 RepID=A0A9N9AZR3_9GLOM|nr:7568_t:CDS:2 [Paraglomus occultum]